MTHRKTYEHTITKEVRHVGVEPHPAPLPEDVKYDRELLLYGDRRNVLDMYRYWTIAAIKKDLDTHRQPLEIAVENVTRDFNMGTIIRNANAFNIAKIHIIGKKQWNKRGAMVTDVYMNIVYHKDVSSFLAVTKAEQKAIFAIDIVKGSQPLSTTTLPKNVVMVFGSEGEGLSSLLLQSADAVVHIEQFGSTRSVNVGVASGIAMYTWLQKHALTR